MYARGVSRQIKRINRRKQEREAPAAVITNHCSPTVTRSIDQRDFINNILPIAINNRWLVSTPPVVDIIGGTMTVSGDTIDFEEGAVIAVMGTFSKYANQSGNFNIYLADGTSRNISLSGGGGITEVNYRFYISSLFFVRISVSSSDGVYSPINPIIDSPIVRLELTTGTFAGDLTAASLSVIGGDIGPNPAVMVQYKLE